VCALYPDLMNIYADRGNLLVLERRCAWRGLGFGLEASSLGEQLEDVGHQLYYIGGGQDRDQRLCAEDLLENKRDALRSAAARGAVVLGVCGGYQLLGHSYTLGREEIAGVGLLDAITIRGGGERLIGNIAIQTALEAQYAAPGSSSPSDAHTNGSRSVGAVLAGFENHGGRTELGAGAQPLGRVLRGHGNNGRSGFEGARQANVIGTYMHGPLLPKNVWFADWLIACALGVDPATLAPLDDRLERDAHAAALRVAGS
jgi:CobQ-like glutamine amidotransferase family enzyme